MKTIIYLTAAYPYFPGEQFIEEEIRYFSSREDCRVVCVPATASGQARTMPEGVVLDLSMANSAAFVPKAMAALRAVFGRVLWLEVLSLFSENRLNLVCLRSLFRSVVGYERFRYSLNNIVSKEVGPVIAYAYWNDLQAYAASSLRLEGRLTKVFSRAHGFDVYAERRAGCYMPLKKQFLSGFCKVFAVSSQGRSYLVDKYGYAEDVVECRPLGVVMPKGLSAPTDADSVHILSVSYLIPLKRIDKIIRAIALAAESRPNVSFTWTHIGGGPLMADLEQLASSLLSETVAFSFLGELKNEEVCEFLSRNRIDFLINASESEGVPVSMMEAMSFGIPVLGTNVGGVAELVSDDSGVLVDVDVDDTDLSLSILSMSEKAKEPAVRSRAREIVESKYSSQKNYEDLAASICSG